MLKKKIVWTYFADGKTLYDIFKDYDISKNVKGFEKITYIRFDKNGNCCFRWTPQENSEGEERAAYISWIEDNGYTELKMFGEDREYVGTI